MALARISDDNGAQALATPAHEESVKQTSIPEPGVEDTLRTRVTDTLSLFQRALWEYQEVTGKQADFLMGNHLPPEIPQGRLRNCKCYSNREKLLGTLPRPQIVAEVGTLYGEFARFMLDLFEPRELHLFDLDLTTRLRDDVRGAPNVQLHEGDSSTNLSSMPDNYFDLIYIDAGHRYEEVKKDCIAAVAKIKADGILVFNDYAIWSPWEGWAYGVVQAVNELICEGWDVIGFALAGHGYHDIAITRVQSHQDTAKTSKRTGSVRDKAAKKEAWEDVGRSNALSVEQASAANPFGAGGGNPLTGLMKQLAVVESLVQDLRKGILEQSQRWNETSSAVVSGSGGRHDVTPRAWVEFDPKRLFPKAKEIKAYSRIRNTCQIGYPGNGRPGVWISVDDDHNKSSNSDAPEGWGIVLQGPPGGYEWCTFELFLDWGLVRSYREFELVFRSTCSPAGVAVMTYFELLSDEQKKDPIGPNISSEEGIDVRPLSFNTEGLDVDFSARPRLLFILPPHTAFRFCLSDVKLCGLR